MRGDSIADWRWRREDPQKYLPQSGAPSPSLEEPLPHAGEGSELASGSTHLTGQIISKLKNSGAFNKKFYLTFYIARQKEVVITNSLS